jgi:transposase-like protein
MRDMDMKPKIRSRFEIKIEPLQVNEKVGLCPSCEAGPIRMTSVNGNISAFLCLGCYERFQRDTKSTDKIFCYALGKQSDKQLVHDFGKIVGEGKVRFFESHLENF